LNYRPVFATGTIYSIKDIANLAAQNMREMLGLVAAKGELIPANVLRLDDKIGNCDFDVQTSKY
jgi:hypothetical protein